VADKSSTAMEHSQTRCRQAVGLRIGSICGEWGQLAAGKLPTDGGLNPKAPRAGCMFTLGSLRGNGNLSCS